MSNAILLGLGMQTMIVALVFRRVGGQWPSHIGALFLLVAYAYHGLTEVAQWLVPDRNAYRWLMLSADVDAFVLLVSVAIVCFGLAYLLALGPRPQAVRPAVMPLPRTGLIALTIPAYLTVLAAQSGLSGYAAAGLASQFVLPLLVLTGTTIAARAGRAQMLVIAIAAVLAALIGSRLTVIAVVIGILGCLQLLQGAQTISRRALALAAVVTVIGGLLITGAREQAGREAVAAAGFSERVSIFSDGVAGLDRDAILDSVIYRFDGNAFGALIHQAFATGAQPVGSEPFFNAFWLAVPRFLNPDKLVTSLETRNEEAYIVTAYGLPNIDYLPMLTGILYAESGAIGLIAWCTVLGVLAGRFDRWVRRSPTVLTIPLYAGLAVATVFLEGGIEGYTVKLRGLVLLAVILLAARATMRVTRPSDARAVRPRLSRS